MDKLSLSLVQRNAKRTEGGGVWGGLSKVQVRVWKHSEGSAKFFSPASNKARGRKKFFFVLFTDFLLGLRKVHVVNDVLISLVEVVSNGTLFYPRY